MSGVDSAVSFLLTHPEWGWLLVVAFALEQLFAPWPTKTKRLTRRVESRIERVEQMQKAQMTVIRALARVQPGIDTDEVDEYLEANGVSPDEFIREEEDVRGAD